MVRLYHKALALKRLALFLAKEGSQDKRILENKKFIAARPRKRQVLLQAYHDLSLNHVVIGLVQSNGLFEDRLLANAH